MQTGLTYWEQGIPVSTFTLHALSIKKWFGVEELRTELSDLTDPLLPGANPCSRFNTRRVEAGRAAYSCPCPLFVFDAVYCSGLIEQ